MDARGKDPAASDAVREGRDLDRALAVFGTRVRERRKTLGISQDVAAERAGISQSNWSKVERGAVDPSLTLVLRIQMALTAPSIESLFGAFPSEGAVEASSEL